MPIQKDPTRDFVRQVRSALTHLYDPAYLQNHALAQMTDVDYQLDQITRAQNLRRTLLDCIESLRPPSQEDALPDVARAHAILTYRFVDCSSMSEIAHRCGLGERQAYRELSTGVEAVARLLWDKLRESGDRESPSDVEKNESSGSLQAAQDEVTRLRRARSFERLDLEEILRGVVQLLTPVCEKNDSAVRVESLASCPPVLADRVMLRQALLGILTQAVNVTQGDVTISVEEHDLELSLSITGVSASTAQNAPRPGRDASAVDLHVAESLLTAQRGRLHVSQEEDQWCAHISLPTTLTPSALVIDDSEELVGLLRRYLAGHDLRVIGAHDSTEALRLAADLQPQVIVLDVMMPDRDGWELLQQLKSERVTSDIPVIVCSVLYQPELASAVGASDYIIKPVTQTGFLQVLTRWLGPLRPVGS